jgi:hypothetical protein
MTSLQIVACVLLWLVFTGWIAYGSNGWIGCFSFWGNVREWARQLVLVQVCIVATVFMLGVLIGLVLLAAGVIP